MLESLGGENDRAAKNAYSGTEDAEGISDQPRCGCSSSSSRVVVYTCPECIAPVLAKMQVVINGR